MTGWCINWNGCEMKRCWIGEPREKPRMVLRTGCRNGDFNPRTSTIYKPEPDDKRCFCLSVQSGLLKYGVHRSAVPCRAACCSCVLWVVSQRWGTVRWRTYMTSTKPSGHYMYHRFNIQQSYVLPTQCIYVFWVDLRINSDYFPLQH